eukprot:Skav205957  [mRNA]  locus=scaffold442:162398:163429:+ [translate_table: standard]
MAACRHNPRRWVCFLSFLVAVFCFCVPGVGFARPRQESSRMVREREGRAHSVSARDQGNFKLTRQQKRLLGDISSAGKRGDWIEAESLFSAEYIGDCAPIYTAVMHAAFRCRKYKDGAMLYDQCRQECTSLDQPVYVQALRIFGKLRETARVREVWDEALEKLKLDAVLASARLAAAADEGDPETAGEVLDLLETKGIPINELHISSAIRACWGWGNKAHKAAKYFYDLCPRFGVKPNLIVFTCLIGAYKTAPVEAIVSAYDEMRKFNIAPNTPFAETYVVSVLRGDKTVKWVTPDDTAELLRELPVERLQAAQAAISDFERAGVRLTRLAQMSKDALKKLRF